MQSFQITRRNLPHWQDPGSVYFLTWRRRSGQALSSEERTITLDAILFWNGAKWHVYVAVVMPDHVHILAQPLLFKDGLSVNLSKIVHSVKSYSAQQISRLRISRGSIWQEERYDRIVRDEAEFLEKWQYIRNNPVKEGLAETPEEYPWLFEKAD